MLNEKVRLTAMQNRIFMWEIAAHIGISEATLGRWLRVPLSEEREQQLLNAIHELCVEKGEHRNA